MVITLCRLLFYTYLGLVIPCLHDLLRLPLATAMPLQGTSADQQASNESIYIEADSH